MILSAGTTRLPARVLVVDDEESTRDILKVMLSDENYAVVGVGSGEEALEAFQRHSPDIVLVDVMLPGISGFELTKRIKEDPLTSNIPVIIVTSLDDRASRMEGLGAGAEEFLTKPIDRAELVIRVRNLLRLKTYGEHQDAYSHLLESEVASRTAELVQSRDQAQRYLDAAQVILIACDLEARVTLINPYGCAILERTSGELIGRHFMTLCIPEYARGTAPILFEELLSGDLSVRTNGVLTKSGKERMIEWRSRLLTDADGRVSGAFSCGTDVTESKAIAAALESADERTRFALDAANVGIWDMDYRAGLLRWSEKNEAHYGLAPGTFGGRSEDFIERVHPDDREFVLGSIEKANASGEDFYFEHRVVWPDGTLRWLAGAGRVHRDPDGLPVRALGVSIDVTDRHLLEKQFEQSQKMEAIGRLASGVAHDFNNLLTVIMGFADLMAADVPSASQHGKDLGEILKAAQRATGLTKQLLAFSRQQVLNVECLDVNELIRDMNSMFGRLIGENIEVVLTLATDACDALGDRSQLEQVLMNLVVNSRDAMPDGGRLAIETSVIQLEQSAVHEESVVAGPYVMIAITDNGHGMSRETQARLFEPFFTTKEVGKGTGLGLSTTYGIVKQSQGYISVYSELGKGTTFKVCLPCFKSDPDGMQSWSSSAEMPSAPVFETILLVEDEAGVRELSKRILLNAGYHVLEAANGKQAEEIFATHVGPIHLIATDIVMPGASGPETVARLRAIEPHLRFLYMSGYTEQSAADRAGLGKGAPFVQKPFTAGEFTRHIRDALSRDIV